MLNGSIQDLEKGSTAEALEPMLYPARLVTLVDCGMHDGQYGLKHTVVATFELPTEQSETDEGEPRARLLSAFFNIPAGYTTKSKWVQFTEMMNKKGESYSDMLGKACQIDVTQYEQEGVKKNRINGTAALGRGMDVAEAITPTIMVSSDSWDVIDNLEIADWLKEKVKNRVEG